MKKDLSKLEKWFLEYGYAFEWVSAIVIISAITLAIIFLT